MRGEFANTGRPLATLLAWARTVDVVIYATSDSHNLFYVPDYVARVYARRDRLRWSEECDVLREMLEAEVGGISDYEPLEAS